MYIPTPVFLPREYEVSAVVFDGPEWLKITLGIIAVCVIIVGLIIMFKG